MNIIGHFNLKIGGDFNRFDGHEVLQHGLMISGGDRPTADITLSVENSENPPVEDSYRTALVAALDEFHGVILRSR